MSKEGWEGYDPNRMRLSVWGLNGYLAEDLAERGTLGTRKIVREASPGDPFGGPIWPVLAGCRRLGATVDMSASVGGDRPMANSYWVVPARFVAGEYPGARSREEAAGRLRILLRAGLDHSST